MNRTIISNEERDLVFGVANGTQEVVRLIGSIRVLCSQTKHMDYLGILRWFLKERIIGYKFTEFLKTKCDNSLLELMVKARKGMTKDFKTRKVFINNNINYN